MCILCTEGVHQPRLYWYWVCNMFDYFSVHQCRGSNTINVLKEYFFQPAANVLITSRLTTHESRPLGDLVSCWTEVNAGLFTQTAASAHISLHTDTWLFQDQQLCPLRTLPVCVCVCVCVCVWGCPHFPTMPLLCVRLRVKGGHTPQPHVETETLTSRHTREEPHTLQCFTALLYFYKTVVTSHLRWKQRWHQRPR